MAIEDVIRDLHIYFDSIAKPVQIRAHMGGLVNSSYLTVHRELEHTVFPFWSAAGGSSQEEKLAVAFRDDIAAWLTKLENDRGRQNEQDQARRRDPPEDQDHSAQKPVGRPRVGKDRAVADAGAGDRNPAAKDVA